jgi:FlgD Ig-like domain
MVVRRVARAWLRWCLALPLLLATPALVRGQGVHVGILPATQNVALNAEFDVEINVTQAGSAFNAFETTISYDPAALTFMPAAPTSLQQGCLMTGTCSAACGNTFHHFTAAGDSLIISDVLLCDQVALTGPGQVYKLHFKAAGTAQTTNVHFRRASFYNAGLFVNPVTTADATIGIGTTVGVGDGRMTHGLSLRAEPNPASGPVSFAIESDAAAVQRIVVFDLSGRVVRQLAEGWQASGGHRVAWDGTDGAGARVPAGVYLVTLRAGARVIRTRVALLR